jgi:hypothetical protein
MAWNRPLSAQDQIVAKSDLKLCELCGALNYHRNGECFTCGWRGVFNRDPSSVDLAWRRLSNELACVRLEHVTARFSSGMGELGIIAESDCDGSVYQRVVAWWRALLLARDRRAEEREQQILRRANLPPNGLGV